MMGREEREYSLAELLDYPIVGQKMINDGIERRSLDLMLDQIHGGRARTDERSDAQLLL